MGAWDHVRFADAAAGRCDELFAHLPGALLATDERGAVTATNRPACDLFDPRSAPGTPIAQFIPPGERERFQRWLSELLRGDERARTARFGWLPADRRPSVACQVSVARNGQRAEPRFALLWSVVRIDEPAEAAGHAGCGGAGARARFAASVARLAAAAAALDAGATLDGTDDELLALVRGAIDQLETVRVALGARSWS